MTREATDTEKAIARAAAEAIRAYVEKQLALGAQVRLRDETTSVLFDIRARSFYISEVP